MKVKVYFSDRQKKVEAGAPLRSLVRKALVTGLRYLDYRNDCEISVTFTDNTGIRVLNARYRNIDKETDVLSFPTGDDLSSGPVILGDIVISLEKAGSQAEELGHSFEREVSFLAVHSLLHLLGYDHETSKKDEKLMFSKQKEIMELLEGKNA